MSAVVELLIASAGVWVPALAGLLVAAVRPGRGDGLARVGLLAALWLGAASMLVLGPRTWVVEGSVAGRALLSLSPAARVLGCGVLVSGALAVHLERDQSLARQGRFVVIVASCAAFCLCADLVSLVAVAFAVSIAEAWFRRAEDVETPVEVMGPVVVALGAALVYGGLSTTSFGELSSRVSAVFTKWGGAMQFLGPLERDLPLPDGVRSQFVGDVVTGAAPAMLTLVGIAILVAGLLVTGRYVVAPGRTEPMERVVNGVCRLAIVAPFVAIFVHGLGAPRLVWAPYGWPAMLVVVLGLGLVSSLTNRVRPRPTLLDVAGSLTAGCVLLIATQLAVARPLMGGEGTAQLDELMGFAAFAAVGVCVGGIVLVHRPMGGSRALAFALVGLAPPSAGLVALVGAASLDASPLVSGAALASVAITWWFVPSMGRANPKERPIPWPIAAVLGLLLLAPFAPPVARFLGL